MTNIKVALIAVVITTGIFLALLVKKNQATAALQAELAEARQKTANFAQLEAENQRLPQLEAELRKLREDNKELPRLRGDLTRLRQELSSATNQLARLARSTPAAGQAVPAETGRSAMQTASGVARAALAPGQTLIMGGWPAGNGKRTIALFTPEAAANESGVVTISGRYIQVPEAFLASPGWEQFLAATQDKSGTGTLSAEQTKQILETLQKSEGVDMMASPRIATLGGASASISIGDTDGAGLSATLLPVIAPDGKTVDLTVSNSLKQLPLAPGQ